MKICGLSFIKNVKSLDDQFEKCLKANFDKYLFKNIRLDEFESYLLLFEDMSEIETDGIGVRCSIHQCVNYLRLFIRAHFIYD